MKPNWTCKKCNEEIEDGFDACWKCGALRDGSQPPKVEEKNGENDPVSLNTSEKRPGSIMSRYKDAYLTANSITSFGATIKIIALVIAGFIVLIGFTNQNALGLYSILFAVGICIPIYILGILVSAQGQILKATLDTAVNTSQFLKKEEMRRIMFGE
jgi:hypothetical protein